MENQIKDKNSSGIKMPISTNRYNEENINDVKIIRHETIESILIFFTGEEELENSVVSTETFDNRILDITMQHLTDSIQKMGLCGFALKEEKEIHYWIGESKDRKDLIFFIAHELGHLIGQIEEDDKEEEHRADSYGYVALKAIELVNNIDCC